MRTLLPAHAWCNGGCNGGGGCNALSAHHSPVSGCNGHPPPLSTPPTFRARDWDAGYCKWARKGFREDAQLRSHPPLTWEKNGRQTNLGGEETNLGPWPHRPAGPEAHSYQRSRVQCVVIIHCRLTMRPWAPGWVAADCMSYRRRTFLPTTEWRPRGKDAFSVGMAGPGSESPGVPTEEISAFLPA